MLNPLFKEWLEKAERDFHFACRNLEDPENPYLDLVCFHFHQSAEKYLKSFIVAHDLEFKRIHDLVELLRICEEKGPSFSTLSSACEFLTDFYIETRYPVPWPSGVSREEAEKARKYAESIRDFVRNLLNIKP